MATDIYSDPVRLADYNTTPEQIANEDPHKAEIRGRVEQSEQVKGIIGAPPNFEPQQKDLSDLIAKWTHAFDLNNLVTAGSRKSDFMSGPLGDTSKPMTSVPMATAGKTTLGG